MDEFVVVYQDCPTCGNRKKWGKNTIEGAKKLGKAVRFVSFATPEGQHLCKLAIYAGITKLPFITNGNKFSQDIATFAEKPRKPRTRKKKEVVVVPIKEESE